MAVCEILLALGLTFGGACKQEPAQPRGLPASDPAVFSYEKPEPPKPPAQAKVITMPPVIVEKEVIREVEKPVVETKEVVRTQTVTKYIEPPKAVPRQPTEYELMLQTALRERAAMQSELAGADITGDFSDAGNRPAPMNANLPGFPPPDGIDPQNDRYSAPPRYSTGAVDNTRILTADRYITGILESGINSQLADNGSVVVQVSRDVYGYHGRTKLVPKGSRMICEYSSVDKVGQTRVGFSCSRILLGESRAEIYQLKAHIGDAQGYAGLSGEVNSRFWEKYGSAILTTGIGTAVEAAVSGSQQIDSSNSNIVANGLSGASENIGTITAALLEDTVDLKPVIRIAQGTRVQVRPKFDWYLADPPQN
ncbi:conjugal transfer protein TrbI (plasmid) [Roseibium aggregatum]|uniref:TrbI/VirB10 family protein n=1 Tax=Roseibium aggregatum TaxID=187304 RepID=UPI001E2FAD7E|nr:TrbI/VirB10 family protein [Roseibium aggregatum]UES60257.1 conjugal transfer protein TrbI [Roseibium aggregatum]